MKRRAILFATVPALAPPFLFLHGEEPATTPLVKVSGATWPPTGDARVVGYRFKLPGEEAQKPPEGGFSLLRGSSVDMARLKQAAIKSAKLSAAQIKKLTEGVFSKTKRLTPAACYEPHHLFLFLDKKDGVTHSIEICFACTSVRTLPEIKKSQWFRHDFPALARLCHELGLWPDSEEPLDRFLRQMELEEAQEKAAQEENASQ